MRTTICESTWSKASDRSIDVSTYWSRSAWISITSSFTTGHSGASASSSDHRRSRYERNDSVSAGETAHARTRIDSWLTVVTLTWGTSAVGSVVIHSWGRPRSAGRAEPTRKSTVVSSPRLLSLIHISEP